MRKFTVLVGLLAFFIASPAFATITFTIDSTPANVNFLQNNVIAQTGSLDVYLTKDATAYSIAAYNARVDLGTPGITLDNVGTTSALHPSLFSPSNPVKGAGSTASLLRAADNLAAGSAAATDGAGLFSIKFTIPVGVSGDFPLTLNANETFLFDGNGNSITLGTPASVTIHVASITAPEPGSLGLLGLAAVGFLRRRRAA